MTVLSNKESQDADLVRWNRYYLKDMFIQPEAGPKELVLVFN